MAENKSKSKWVIAALGLLGVSLIATGVFASASININSDNLVNLGAGKAEVTACQQQANVSTHQEFNDTENRYELTSITIDSFDTRSCDGKSINMALSWCDNNQANCQTQYAKWENYTDGENVTLTWDDRAGTADVSSIALPPIDTSTLGYTYLAISEE